LASLRVFSSWFNCWSSEASWLGVRAGAPGATLECCDDDPDPEPDDPEPEDPEPDDPDPEDPDPDPDPDAEEPDEPEPAEPEPEPDFPAVAEPDEPAAVVPAPDPAELEPVAGLVVLVPDDWSTVAAAVVPGRDVPAGTPVARVHAPRPRLTTAAIRAAEATDLAPTRRSIASSVSFARRSGWRWFVKPGLIVKDACQRSVSKL
jgi:hypothetical protein